MVEMDGQTFCCKNCQMMSMEQPFGKTDYGTCAHCQSTIFDASMRVERNGQFFCCPNCAATMGQTHPAGAGRAGSRAGSQEARPSEGALEAGR
jgi:hypothetical protein